MIDSTDINKTIKSCAAELKMKRGGEFNTEILNATMALAIHHLLKKPIPPCDPTPINITTDMSMEMDTDIIFNGNAKKPEAQFNTQSIIALNAAIDFAIKDITNKTETKTNSQHSFFDSNIKTVNDKIFDDEGEKENLKIEPNVSRFFGSNI